ncbi:hypothetical protein EPO04_03485 [Patescibacteria group bacterium]|nr:MAG: hypothetical protein EPO04_03485 [Patescibacteria group bacterium]
MKQIVWRELRDRKWSLLAYCLGSLLMLWLYVATYESSKNSSAQLQELVKTYPKAFLEAVGLGNLTLNTVEVYLNAKHFSLLWPLIAIVLALSRAGNQIAGEVQSGTMGLLLALPLERWRIFAAKYAAGLATIIIFTGVSVFGVIPLAAAYNIPTHLNILFPAWIITTLFMWVVYSVALMVSSWVSEKAQVYAVVGVVLLATYLAYIVSLIETSVDWLKYYSLFYYFNTQEVLATGHISKETYLAFGVTIILSTAIAAWRFNKRDVSV